MLPDPPYAPGTAAGPVRPKLRGALSLKDVKAGLRVTVHHSRPRPYQESLQLVSAPVQDERWVEVLPDPAPPGAKPYLRSLADMGVVPYPSGYWSLINHTVRASTKNPAK